MLGCADAHKDKAGVCSPYANTGTDKRGERLLEFASANIRTQGEKHLTLSYLSLQNFICICHYCLWAWLRSLHYSLINSALNLATSILSHHDFDIKT